MSSKTRKSHAGFTVLLKNLDSKKFISKIKKIELPFPLHPFLFGLFPILFFVSHNRGLISPLNSDVLTTILITLFFTVASWIILNIFLKSGIKAGLITSLFLVLFFSYGHIESAVQGFNFTIGGLSIGKDKTLFPLWVTAFALGSYFLIKTRIELGNLSKLLNVISASLIVFSLFTIVTYEIELKRMDVNEITHQIDGGKLNLKKQKQLPDIYYILVDAYPSFDTLNSVYGYKNSKLDKYLQGKDFYISRDSNSNYAMTYLSLSSTLNLEYINYYSDELGEDSTSNVRPILKIEDNKIVPIFQSMGYKFASIGSGWFATDHNDFNEITPNVKAPSNKSIRWLPINVNEFTIVYLQTTLLKPIIQDSLKNTLADEILIAFERIKAVSSMDEPTFTFAHLTVPHPPHLFDDKGNVLDRTKIKFDGNAWHDKERFLNQVKFVDLKLEETVETIFNNSNEQPIIVIASDHGSSSMLGGAQSWKEPGDYPDAAIQERFGILNTYYFPGKDYSNLYQRISPVNTFRVILNQYFNGNYELLDDFSYYANLKKFYKFTDVTKRLK